MNIKLREKQVNRPDLMLDVEKEDDEFYLIAIDKDGTKYDLVWIDPESEEYKIYPDKFKEVGLTEVEK